MIKLIFRSISAAMQGIFIGTSFVINYFDQKPYLNKDDKLISLYVAMYNVFMMQALLFTLHFSFPGFALGTSVKMLILFLPIIAGAANGGYTQIQEAWKNISYLKHIINVINNILYYMPNIIKYLLTYLLQVLHLNFRHILLFTEIVLLFLSLQYQPIFAATSLLFMSVDTIFYFNLLPISLEVIFASIERIAFFFEFIFINDWMLRIQAVFRLLLDMRTQIFKQLIPQVIKFIKDQNLYGKFENDLKKELICIPKDITMREFLTLMKIKPPAINHSSPLCRTNAIINELQQLYCDLTKSIADQREHSSSEILMKLEDLLVKKDFEKNKFFKTSFAHIHRPALEIAKIDPVICVLLNKKLNDENHYKIISHISEGNESYINKLKKSAKFKDEFPHIEDEKELLFKWQEKLSCQDKDVFTLYIKNKFEEIISNIQMLKDVALDISAYPQDKMTLTYHYGLNLLFMINTNLEQHNNKFAYAVIMDMILNKNEECDLAIYDIVDELYNKYIKVNLISSLPVKERLQYFLFEHRKRMFNEIYFAISQSTLFKVLFAFRDPINRHIYYETLDYYDIEKFMNFYKNQELSTEDKYIYSLIVRIFMYIENGYSPEYITSLLNDNNENTSVLGFEINKCRRDWALEFLNQTLSNYILELIEQKKVDDLQHIDSLMLWDKQILSIRTRFDREEIPIPVNSTNTGSSFFSLRALERLGIDPKSIPSSLRESVTATIEPPTRPESEQPTLSAASSTIPLIELPVRSYITPIERQRRNNNIIIPNITIPITRQNVVFKSNNSNILELD